MMKNTVKSARGPEKIHMKEPKLLSKSQQTALQLMKKEEINAKRSRLECLLVQQYVGKYGNKSPNSEINDCIKGSISQFLDSYSDLTVAESNLSVLETSIRENVMKMKRMRVAQRKEMAEEARKVLEKTENNNTNDSNSNSNDQSNNSQKIEENRWPVISAILAADDEVRRMNEARAAAGKKYRFQEDLNEQIKMNRRKKLSEAEEREQLLKMTKLQLEEYNKEQQEIRMRKDEHLRIERELRLGQIEEKKLMKEMEKQRRIAQEKQEMARAKRAASEEQEQQRLMREKIKKQQEQLFEENERNKALKAEQLRAQQEYEKKLNREYE